METQNVISHLIEVEQLADELILETQKEADKRLAEVRSAADAKYREAYDAVIQQLEAEYTAAVAAGDLNRKELAAAYEKALTGVPQKTAEFNAFLDSVLFGGK